MLATPQTNARLEARISAELHTSIKQIAALENRTVTDFVVSAVQEALQRAIEQRQLIRLSLEHQTQFANALIDPPAIAPALKRAIEKRQLLAIDN
jgi:uncharacterized protein (DUF1778 family)